MNKDKLIKTKKKLIALGLLGVMLGTTGCKNNNNFNIDLDTKSSNIINLKRGNQFYYNKENIYLLFDMKTGRCKEYVINNRVNFNNDVVEEIYDIEKNIVIFSDKYKNGEHDVYYNYLYNNPGVFFICLGDCFANNEVKDYYSIDEIKFLEPYIYNAIINSNNNKKVLVK